MSSIDLPKTHVLQTCRLQTTVSLYSFKEVDGSTE